MDHSFSMHPTRPSNALYDTLDDVDVKLTCSLKMLWHSVFGGVDRYAGVVVAGAASLSDPSSGYWGRAFALESGEYLQMRVAPKGSAGKPLTTHSTRVIAVRRSGLNSKTVQTACAIVFMPRACPTTKVGAMSCGRTAGCRGLHVLLPSIFSKHNATREKNAGHSNIDMCGFHSVRPYTFTITNRATFDGTKVSASTSVAAGPAYVALAGQLAGVNVADPLVRTHVEVSENKYKSQMSGMIAGLSRAVGEAAAADALSSALTVVDMLGVEGLLGILCNSFFEGVLPDTVHAPSGMPLLIVVACRIAIFHDRFGLPAPTAIDVAANNELRMLFETRWKPVSAGAFAVDAALKAGVDSSDSRITDTPAMKSLCADNLIFWQRVGQRVITKAFSDALADRKQAAKAQYQTRFGPAELLMDGVSDAKYAWLEKLGHMQALAEAPVNKVTFASHTQIRAQLLRVHDLVEHWLRTGHYGEVCLNRPNVNVGVRPPKTCAQCGSAQCDCIESCASSSDDGDDVLDNKMCTDAFEQAATAISIAFLNGAFAMHNFGIVAFLAGDKITNTCADCDARVDVLHGVLLANASSACALCDRPRCFRCQTRSLGKPRQQHCLRCGSPPAKAAGKKKKK